MLSIPTIMMFRNTKRPAPKTHAELPTEDTGGRFERLAHAIKQAVQYLPPQGPIGVFIAQNPLQSLESRPFDEAVIEAARDLDAEPFLSESRYREELSAGRITVEDIDAVIAEQYEGIDGDRMLCNGMLSLRDLHRILLLHPVCRESDVGARWTLTESDIIERLRADLPGEIRSHMLHDSVAGGGIPDAGDVHGEGFDGLDHDDVLAADPAMARRSGNGSRERHASADLWSACLESLSPNRPSLTHTRPPARHRDLILAADPSLDTDALVHPLLIRWCAAFLDQGVAAWPMPGRERGLLQAVAALSSGSAWRGHPWSTGLATALRDTVGQDSRRVILAELDRLGLEENEWNSFITRTLQALPGWAGMIHHLQQRPERAPVVRVPASIEDFLALRLVCDRVAVEWAADRIGFPRHENDAAASAGRSRLRSLRAELEDRYPPKRGAGTLARAMVLHQVAQLAGLVGRDVRGLDENEFLRFEEAITAFDGLSRRRLLHLAYERRYRMQTLDALDLHRSILEESSAPRPRPILQAIFCMDERCESFRRHLEELDPRHETFGTAGFFAVPMSFRGIDDWHSSPLCPIVLRPRHSVFEVPDNGAEQGYERRRSRSRQAARLRAGFTAGSRTLFGGGLLTALFGAAAAVPLVAGVVFPRLAAGLWRRLGGIGRTGPQTRLLLERHADEELPDGTLPGFSVQEMASCVRRVLEDIGLVSGFSRFVAVVGHGSTSRNNPHQSAYHCGACGGGPGGPNARAFAMMANDPRVRDALAAEGIAIPSDTVFIGGMLDTCSDTVTWYDRLDVPTTHEPEADQFFRAFERGCALDAHERCRRFDSVPLELTPAGARTSVEARAVDLAQVRPEFGHATNALCIVGRRERTRGLYLDRRAFLVSYDPTTDSDDEVLVRTLAAIGPVASGINLAYFFSKVDRLRFGCGTKLPHNITGLLGVMDGHASDLRTGLPWQTVEIHEPMRLLMVIESRPERILAAAERVPAVRQLFTNAWVQLAAWDPEDGTISVFDGREFRPHVREQARLPVVDRSRSWYGGRRGHLPPAQVLAGMARPAGGVRFARTRHVAEAGRSQRRRAVPAG